MTMHDLAPDLWATSAPTLPASLRAVRAALAGATADYLAITDDSLEKSWTWRDHELDVRYGVYRAVELVEATGAAIDELLRDPAHGRAIARGRAALRIAPATEARWTLHGRVASLDDAILDPVAKDGEWTVRETLGHIVDGQRSYGWFTRWWASRPAGDPLPPRVPADVEAQSERELPGETADGAGSLAEIRVRFDDCLDEWALRFASVEDARLATPAVWSGTPVDIDFRLGRWASHVAEHTIQLDKTLDWLGYQPSEVVRIVRRLHDAFGRLESRIYPATNLPAELEALLGALAANLTSEARSARAAAGA